MTLHSLVNLNVDQIIDNAARLSVIDATHVASGSGTYSDVDRIVRQVTHEAVGGAIVDSTSESLHGACDLLLRQRP